MDDKVIWLAMVAATATFFIALATIVAVFDCGDRQAMQACLVRQSAEVCIRTLHGG